MPTENYDDLLVEELQDVEVAAEGSASTFRERKMKMEG
jgi:hypothetical protein